MGRKRIYTRTNGITYVAQKSVEEYEGEK